MNLPDIVSYLFACFVMGLGIAIDVALASVTRAAQLASARAVRRWVIRITATHVAFPMIGYYGALQLERMEAIRPALGAIAFLLIAVFLYRMLRGLIGTAGEPNAGEAFAEPGWPLVLAVSWDALWSGPAKAAQAVGWSPLEVALSFPLAGLVVAAAAILSTLSARRLRERAMPLVGSARRQVSAERAALMLEVAIFSYFAFLALFTFSLELDAPLTAAIASAAAATALVQLVLGRRIAAAVRRLQPAEGERAAPAG